MQFSEGVILPERQPEMVTADVTALPSERSDCLSKTAEKFQTEQAEPQAFTYQVAEQHPPASSFWDGTGECLQKGKSPVHIPMAGRTQNSMRCL